MDHEVFAPEVPGRPLLLVGDTDTAGQLDNLRQLAALRGATVAGTAFFDVGSVARSRGLIEAPVLVTALGTAVRQRWDVWAPWVQADLGRPVARDAAVNLARHGLSLRAGPELSPWPKADFAEPLDVAAAFEVIRADRANAAVIAAAAAPSLMHEIAAALAGVDAAGGGVKDGKPARASELVRVGRELSRTRNLAAQMLADPSFPGLPTGARDVDVAAFAEWAATTGASRATVAELLNAAGFEASPGQPFNSRRLAALVRRVRRSSIRGGATGRRCPRDPSLPSSCSATTAEPEETS